jgi:hypothetical protein
LSADSAIARVLELEYANAQTKCARPVLTCVRNFEPMRRALHRAANRGMLVVTRNARDFRKTGVKVLGPFA